MVRVAIGRQHGHAAVPSVPPSLTAWSYRRTSWLHGVYHGEAQGRELMDGHYLGLGWNISTPAVHSAVTLTPARPHRPSRCLTLHARCCGRMAYRQPGCRATCGSWHPVRGECGSAECRRMVARYESRVARHTFIIMPPFQPSHSTSQPLNKVCFPLL